MPTGSRLSLSVHLLGDAKLLVCSHPIRARHQLSVARAESKFAATHRSARRLCATARRPAPLSKNLACSLLPGLVSTQRPRLKKEAQEGKQWSGALYGALSESCASCCLAVSNLAHECPGQNLGSVCSSGDCDLRIFCGRDVFVLVERERPEQGTARNLIACGSRVKGEIRWRVGGSRLDTLVTRHVGDHSGVGPDAERRRWWQRDLPLLSPFPLFRGVGRPRDPEPPTLAPILLAVPQWNGLHGSHKCRRLRGTGLATRAPRGSTTKLRRGNRSSPTSTHAPPLLARALSNCCL